MSNSNQICFLPEPGDTKSFASSVAINDQYLVVGDPGANRIVVYQKDSQDRWYREREIYPPENSVPYQAGNGFGRNLRLDKNTLLADASSIEPIQKNRPITAVAGSRGQYFVRLDRREEPIPIDTPNNEEGFFQFYILSDDEPELIVLPNKNEEKFNTYDKRLKSFSLYNNLLLIGLPSQYTNGRGLLFDLKLLDTKPIELTSKNGYMGDTVAVSNEFAVVGNSGTMRLNHNYLYHPETLIRSLKNDSNIITDIQGKLSLDRNLLTVMLPSSRSYFRSVALLQVFRLNEDATPHLIIERKYSRGREKYLTRALVQNGWLISVYRINRSNSIELCLESVEQITDR